MNSLYEIMPEDACGVLQDLNENGDICSFVLDCWSGETFLRVEEFAELAEASEAPVTFLGNEAMVSVWLRR